MTQTASGSLSGFQESTYQENRAERMPDTTFHTKGQLRKLLYFIWEEKITAMKNYERAIEENRILRKENLRIKSEKAYYLNQANNNQEKILEMQEKLLNYYGIEKKPYMKVVN